MAAHVLFHLIEIIVGQHLLVCLGLNPANKQRMPGPSGVSFADHPGSLLK